MIEGPMEMLRAAAAWLRLAAEEIEHGNEDKARSYAKLGRLGIQSHMLTRWIENDPVPK